MKTWILATAALAAIAVQAPAAAVVVLADSFTGENGGNTALNYVGFANFTVSAGSVDLIKSGDYGITCVGGAGSCIDLDGTTNNGATLTTTTSYAFNAGDTVSLTIELSGNQRNFGPDEFSYGFNTSAATAFNNVIVTGAFGAPVNVGNLGPGLFLGSGRPNGSLGLVVSTEPFTTYGISFVAGNAGTLTAFAGTASADNVGPILDNFTLSVTAVPEPATWSLLIAGFAMTGFAARRRRSGLAI